VPRAHVSIIPSIAGGTATPVGARRASRRFRSSPMRKSCATRDTSSCGCGRRGQRKLRPPASSLWGREGSDPRRSVSRRRGCRDDRDVDFDVVDTTNLQRQILHGTQAVGIPSLSRRARGSRT